LPDSTGLMSELF